MNFNFLNTAGLSSFLFLFIIILGSASCKMKLNEEHPQITKGAKLYNKYCIECHAADGKGTPNLREHYSKIDLTKINYRRDLEEFPIMEIAKYIDGRNHYKEFGSRQMPMWGVDLVSGESAYNPDTARTNMGAILSYLIKIQEQ